MADGRSSIVAFVASLTLAVLTAGSAPWWWPRVPLPTPPPPSPTVVPKPDSALPKPIVDATPIPAPACNSGFFLQTASGMQKTIGLPYDATQNALRAKPRPALAGACFVEFTDAVGYPMRFGVLLPLAAQVGEARQFVTDFNQNAVPAGAKFYAGIGEPYRRVFWVDERGSPRTSW